MLCPTSLESLLMKAFCPFSQMGGPVNNGIGVLIDTSDRVGAWGQEVSNMAITSREGGLIVSNDTCS